MLWSPQLMSNRLQTALHSMGWFPERKVNIASWVRIFETNGYTIVPGAMSILENFGGLRIRPVISDGDAFRSTSFLFEPGYAVSTVIDSFEAWQNRLKIKLTPIAEDLGGLGALMLGDDARVFSSLGGLLRQDGDSFVDALENSIVFPRRIPTDIWEIPYSDS